MNCSVAPVSTVAVFGNNVMALTTGGGGGGGTAGGGGGGTAGGGGGGTAGGGGVATATTVMTPLVPTKPSASIARTVTLPALIPVSVPAPLIEANDALLVDQI